MYMYISKARDLMKYLSTFLGDHLYKIMVNGLNPEQITTYIDTYTVF